MTTILRVRRTTTVRAALVVALLLGLGFALGWVASPSPVYASDEPATPANETAHAHPWNTTGCFIPGATIDAVPGLFDFGHACTHHGGCYEGLDRQGNPATIDRLRCDQLFRADLDATCTLMHGTSTNWRAKECQSTAESYYEVVRSFGAPYYSGSGSSA